MNNTFCPFIGAKCRIDCVFHKQIQVADPEGKTSNCWLAIKIKDINECQHDDFVEIASLLKKK